MSCLLSSFFNTGGGASFTQKSTPKGPTGVVEIPELVDRTAADGSTIHKHFQGQAKPHPQFIA